MALVGDVSPDGRWFWDGQRWVSAVSADGAWRWNGTAWQALGTGTNGGLGALGTYNGQLIAGGSFAAAGSVSASNTLLPK